MAKTYAQFMSQIDALRAKADAARRKEAAGEIKRVRDVIAKYGLTAEDLGFASAPASASAGRGKPEKSASKAATPGADAPKYRDDAGHSWSGRGPKPGWLKAALAQGRALGEFLTQASGAVAPTSASASPDPARTGRGGRRVPSRKSATAKNAAPKAKFSLDGHSWSGRGPQPRWLKEALAGGKTLDELRAG